MGQAQSNNFTDTVMNSYASVLQKTSSSALMNSVAKVKIGVSGGTGDVNISNVLSKQTVVNDLKASFKQTNDSAILQKVSQELQQQASSLIEGLNFGNFSESNNTIKNTITASMDVSQIISTECVSTAVADFDLTVKDQKGNVNIDNLNVEQNVKNGLDCASEALNKSVATQVTENKIIQVAKAETKGITLDFIVYIIVGIIVGIVVLGGIGAKILTNPKILNMMILCLVIGGVGGIDYLIYDKGLKNVNAKIEEITTIMEKNKKVTKQPKPQEQLKTFSYTCGLAGIGNDRACLLPFINTSPRKQNVGGCVFKQKVVDATFTNPDDAYQYWLNKPELKAIDVISRHDGTFDYKFYTEVSNECIQLLTTISKDKTRTYIPPLLCLVKDPVEDIYDPNKVYSQTATTSPRLAATDVSDYTFVFTKDGYLYYSENQKWISVNSSSVFKGTAASLKNIYTSITPPSESEVVVDNNVKGTFYFIDMSKARRNAGEAPASSYYFTIYTCELGSGDRTADKTLKAADFQEYMTLDITNLVLNKEIGPFMTNPLLTKERNMTVIWDTDIETADKENAKLLETSKKLQKNYYIIYGILNTVALICIFLILLNTSKSSNQKQTSKQSSKQTQKKQES